MAYWSSTIDIWEFEDDMNKGPEDRYHDTRTGEFVTDEQGKSDPTGTVLVDHEAHLGPMDIRTFHDIEKRVYEFHRNGKAFAISEELVDEFFEKYSL